MAHDPLQLVMFPVFGNPIASSKRGRFGLVDLKEQPRSPLASIRTEGQITLQTANYGVPECVSGCVWVRLSWLWEITLSVFVFFAIADDSLVMTAQKLLP